MFRDRVVLNHRTLRLIVMRNGRETTLSLNLRIVAYLHLMKVMELILRDRVPYDIGLLRLVVMRHGKESGRGRKGKRAYYHVIINLSRCRE